LSIESETDTLLTVDVGSVNTRACLFDVVEGGYRLVAVGRAPSTVGPPLFDAREGVGMAVGQLQLITGRMLIDETNTLIKPIRLDGSGVDAFAVSTSAGPSLRTVLVGLMPGVSLDSARRLAASSYMKVVVHSGCKSPLDPDHWWNRWRGKCIGPAIGGDRAIGAGDDARGSIASHRLCRQPAVTEFGFRDSARIPFGVIDAEFASHPGT